MLLLHSPLVGASSWAVMAELLADRDVQVSLPDLTGTADAEPPLGQTYVELAVGGAASLTGPTVVVGHSGAGAFLPTIADRLGDRVDSVVFVDAVMPPRHGARMTPEGMRAMLDEVTVGDRLLPWIDWWPPQAIAEHLPDAADRARLRADMPSLPRAFFDEPVPVPDDWSGMRCAYVRLSEGYVDDHREAEARGWPTVAIEADHLAIHSRPHAVLGAIESLVGPLRRVQPFG